MRKEIKAMAKEQIKGKIGKLFLVAIIPGIISVAINLIPVLGSLVSIFMLTPAFAIATTMIYLKVSENENFEVGEVFGAFGWFWSAFKVNFLVGLFVFLWGLIPMVAFAVISAILASNGALVLSLYPVLYSVVMIVMAIKYIPYAMSMYVIAENPAMNARDAIKESKEIMKGHKVELVVLILSFWAWIALSIFTCGLGFIYVLPYIQTTMPNGSNEISCSSSLMRL